MRFTLDPDLPGLRNVTTLDPDQVVFEAVRFSEHTPMPWRTNLGISHVAMNFSPTSLSVQDHSTLNLRVDVTEASSGRWILSLADGVTVADPDGQQNRSLDGPWTRTYTLHLPGNRTTHVFTTEPAYDETRQAFVVSSRAAVTEADGLTAPQG